MTSDGVEMMMHHRTVGLNTPVLEKKRDMSCLDW